MGILALYLLGFDEIALLFGGGLLVMLAENARRAWSARASASALLPLPMLLPSILTQVATGIATFNLWTLFFTFLKIGAVLYGSGYVLLAFELGKRRRPVLAVQSQTHRQPRI